MEDRTCWNCSHMEYEDDRFWGGRHPVCMLMSERGTFRHKKVSTGSTCDNFSPRTTKSNSGYKYRPDCFLTSACVQYMGKADDCEELTALRRFRDGYMKSTEKGAALVEEYYKVAPEIVRKIESSGEKEKYYKVIYDVILKCVGLINCGKYAEAQDGYEGMVNLLRCVFDV